MWAKNKLSAGFIRTAPAGKHSDGGGLWLVKREDGGAQWMQRVTVHVLPKLGKVPVTDIDQRDIRDTLAPIWHTKADTARKAMNRISIVLGHAAALGLDVDLQATEKAKALLGKSRHVAKHIPAMAWADVPAFYASLDEPTLTHLALRLLILNPGVRSKPLRHLRLEQIEGEVWTVPEGHMKGKKGKAPAYPVPLCKEARRIIEQARPHARNGYLFPNTRGGVISDMTLSRLMERRGLEARPHGFRTSLRTWLAEATDAPHEVAEAMLSHATDSGVVRAYRRTDYLEQRLALTERWADYVTGGAGQVVKLVGTAK